MKDGAIQTKASSGFSFDLESLFGNKDPEENEGDDPEENKSFAYSASQTTCKSVCPTAFSVLRSMWSMSSFTVCHVGPKPLSRQSG